MKSRKETQSVYRRMLAAVLFVLLLLTAVILAFLFLRRQEDAKLPSEQDTRQEAADSEAETEQEKVEIDDRTVASSGSAEEESTDAAAETETTSDTKVYLIKGDTKGVNKYERVDRLAYSDTICYTEEELSWLDSSGLRITRNEIYARHGRMFSDQEMQEYFDSQDWYVPLTSPAEFDENCLNDVEQYNVNLIKSCEVSQGEELNAAESRE